MQILLTFDYELFLSLKPSLASISDKLPGSGVNIHNFRPFEKIEKKEITFLMASRLFKEKGVLEYIESAKLIKQKFPQSRFLLIGDIYQSKNNPITIELLKNATDDSRYERKTSTNDKAFFNLKASNGQIIGSSEMYETEASRDNGIESVKKNAPEATVEDNA